LITTWALLGALGCDAGPAASSPPASPAAARSDEVPSTLQLAHRYQCARCHEGGGLEPLAAQQQCVGCHQEILAGRYDASPETLAGWRAHLVSLNHAPSLDAARARLRRDWVEYFLQSPHDLRPHLPATMPRLPIDAAHARELAGWLIPHDDGPTYPLDTSPATLSRGRDLLSSLGCTTCHAFGGVTPIAARPIARAITPADFAAGHALAPDLRHTRARMTPARTVDWILEPLAPMPDLVDTRADAEAITAYLFHAPLAPPASAPSALATRLPVLARVVTFAEINETILRRTCWHCHSDPTYALGDGGPGNTGGLGFPPRELSLADYPSIMSGALADDGTRASIFLTTPLPDGTTAPLLVATLLARREEEAGRPIPTLRGMPLGLPALTLEQIQLLETWIAAGRPE
jgi:hypothetical protein